MTDTAEVTRRSGAPRVDVRFNGYLLRARPLRLSRGDVWIEAPRQSLELLAYLIACGDRPATREELIERFWSLDHVGVEQNLNACVKRLRKALQDSGGDDLIETQPRIGYRFVGTIEGPAPPARSSHVNRLLVGAAGLCAVAFAGLLESGVISTAAPGASPSAVAAPSLRIAVPPGRNLCDTTLFPMFIDGLRENLITDLQSSNPSDVAFLKVGQQNASLLTPGTAFVLDLGVRQMPDRTIANLSLVSAVDGEVIWTRQVSEPTDLNNYLRTQERLSSRLAEAFARRS